MSAASWVAAATLATALSAQTNAAGPQPQRIVSLNLCTDQLLLQLVEPARIVSVTYLAGDPELSTQAGRAQGVTSGMATAEEVILLRPDLALAGEYGAREAVALLRRWGVPIVQLAPAESWEAIREQLRRVAAAVGEVAKGEALLADMDARLRALEARKSAFEPRAILVQDDGVTFGSGTLPEAVLRAAGFRNIASELGIVGYGSITLERLLAAKPDLVVLTRYHAKVPTLGLMFFRHPALAGHELGRLDLPARALFCGTTETVSAVERLVEWRERGAVGGAK